MLSASPCARADALCTPADKPDTEWLYIDPSGARQGPFKGSSVYSWFLAGYLHERQLLVADATGRTPATSEFRPLEQVLGGAPRAAEPPAAAAAQPTAAPVPAPAPAPATAPEAQAAQAGVAEAASDGVAVALRVDEGAASVRVQLT
jgi:hypothetical protein